MPKQYSGMGLTLLYPDSWTATPDDSGQRGQGVFIESPGGSFISINLLEGQPNPDEVVQEAAEAMEEEYEEVESEPLVLPIDGQEFEGIVQRFYYLDFVIVSRLLALPVEAGLFLVQIQGEDRDIDQQSMVFDAILTSMLRSMGHAAQPD